jgi:hypothetical protein
MEQVNLGSVIEQAISRFSQNRIGAKPPLFVMISPALTAIPWHDGSLKEFVRTFLYEVLLRNDPGAIIEIALRRKTALKDLTAFVGVQPSYWAQLRVAGRGLRVMENLIEDLFVEVGYRCEEWVGVADSQARLGIFGANLRPELKMVFGVELTRNIFKCDLLLPVTVPFFPFTTRHSEQATPRT